MKKYNMTKEEADIMFGKPCWESKTVVVRVVERGGNVHVHVHSKDEAGDEDLPLAYMLGSNSLIYKKR